MKAAIHQQTETTDAAIDLKSARSPKLLMLQPVQLTAMGGEPTFSAATQNYRRLRTRAAAESNLYNLC